MLTVLAICTVCSCEVWVAAERDPATGEKWPLREVEPVTCEDCRDAAEGGYDCGITALMDDM